MEIKYSLTKRECADVITTLYHIEPAKHKSEFSAHEYTEYEWDEVVRICINEAQGEESCTLSGEKEDLENFLNLPEFKNLKKKDG